jgi:hypothetical protein
MDSNSITLYNINSYNNNDLLITNVNYYLPFNFKYIDDYQNNILPILTDQNYYEQSFKVNDEIIIKKIIINVNNPQVISNISLSIIDIDSKFLQYCTKNILYQLIGRAGRKGKSHSAMIIFRDDGMFNIILEQSSKNIEAEEVEDNFKKLYSLN